MDTVWILYGYCMDPARVSNTVSNTVSSIQYSIQYSIHTVSIQYPYSIHTVSWLHWILYGIPRVSIRVSIGSELLVVLYNCTSYVISTTVVDVSFIFQVQAPKDQWHRTVNSSALSVTSSAGITCTCKACSQQNSPTVRSFPCTLTLWFFRRVRSL